MKIRKIFYTIILFLLSFFILLSVYYMFFGKRNLYINDIKINLVNLTDDENCIISTDLLNSKAIEFKFNYKYEYYSNNIFSKMFTLNENISNEKIKFISLYLKDIKDKRININKYIYNYIDKSIFTEYVKNEIINPSLNEHYNDDFKNKKTYFDDYVLPLYKSLNEVNEINNYYTKLNKNKLFNKRIKKIKFINQLQVLSEENIDKLNPNKGFYCIEKQTDFYIGNLDFFKELYNNDYCYIQCGSYDIYSGFIMKLTLPKKRNVSWKSIGFDLEFTNGRKISSEIIL